MEREKRDSGIKKRIDGGGGEVPEHKKRARASEGNILQAAAPPSGPKCG
jgi:hypothetical protein